jgi:hypothetical protein
MSDHSLVLPGHQYDYLRSSINCGQSDFPATFEQAQHHPNQPRTEGDMVKHVVKYVLMISPLFLDQFECSWACLKAMNRHCNILSLRNFRTPPLSTNVGWTIKYGRFWNVGQCWLEYQSHKPLLNIGWPHLYSLWYMVILYVSISWVLKN